MNITLIKRLFVLILLNISIIACTPERITKIEVPPIKILTAIGYGTSNMFSEYSPAQRRLMSMRASKMDAYRNLAEQIYGVSINGHTTVSAMVVKNDNYRVYLDAFLKGARVISITAVDADTYETVVEVTLTPKFFTCLSGTAAIHSQCLNGVNSSHNNDRKNIKPELNVASLSAYNCSSIDCYKYPDISGFYNKED
ncbi:MAG: LPP20 family lipoprotein [Methylococcaceae bacterium]|nr:LPP20 family lipoprotein [Methylococcaceae bacterium]